MWITQTYLGNFDTSSDVYLYYFWEDYLGQADVAPSIQTRLAELGFAFKERVSAFSPMPDYRKHIRQEMEEQFRDFWWTFKDRTPGIFLSTKPLRQFDPSSDEWMFFQIPPALTHDEKAATQFFRSLHEKCREIIDRPTKSERRSVLQDLYAATQLKLTFMGLGIDFKPLIARVVKAKKKKN
jgi:hypothetical protein